MFPEGRALEFLLAAVVALVVVGPKDLPVLMRKLGQFIGRMRAMAAEFRASFDEMARQSELDELRKEVEAMRRAQIADIAGDVGPRDVSETFDGLRDDLIGVRSDLGASAPPYYADPIPADPIPEASSSAPAAAKAPRKRAPKAAAKAPAGSRKTVAKPRAKKQPETEA